MVGYKVVDICPADLLTYTAQFIIDRKFAFDGLGNIVPLTFSGVFNEAGVNLGTPSWLAVTNDPTFGDIEYLIYPDVTPYPNDQTFTIRVGTYAGDYNIILQPKCAEVLTNPCCGVELRWINREGGIMNAYFTDKMTINTAIGDGDTYMDGTNTNYLINKVPSVRGRIVSTGGAEYDTSAIIESLCTAIQAWEVVKLPFDGLNEYEYVPILVNKKDIIRTEAGQTNFEYTIPYRYAKDLTTQRG